MLEGSLQAQTELQAALEGSLQAQTAESDLSAPSTEPGPDPPPGRRLAPRRLKGRAAAPRGDRARRPSAPPQRAARARARHNPKPKPNPDPNPKLTARSPTGARTVDGLKAQQAELRKGLEAVRAQVSSCVQAQAQAVERSARSVDELRQRQESLRPDPAAVPNPDP